MDAGSLFAICLLSIPAILSDTRVIAVSVGMKLLMELPLTPVDVNGAVCVDADGAPKGTVIVDGVPDVNADGAGCIDAHGNKDEAVVGDGTKVAVAGYGTKDDAGAGDDGTKDEADGVVAGDEAAVNAVEIKGLGVKGPGVGEGLVVGANG
jgi:hypothetical protein